MTAVAERPRKRSKARANGPSLGRSEDRPQEHASIPAGDGEAQHKPGTFMQLAIGRIAESPTNPRKVFHGLEEMAASMKAHGVLEPLLVRPTYETTNGAVIGGDLQETLKNFPGLRNTMTFQLVAGARRLRSAKLAGLDEVPAIVRELNDRDVAEIQVIENDQREDVHPLDQAAGYRLLIDSHGYDVATLAAKTGRSETYIYQRLQLTKLAKPFQKWLEEERIQLGHALLIGRLQDKDQAELAKEMGVDLGYGGPAPSVKDLKEDIEAKYHLDLATAAFPKDAEDLVAGCGACTTCAKRTGYSPMLFPDIKKKDVCTDRACFESKRQAFVQLQVKKLEQQTGAAVVKVSTEYGRAGKGVLKPYDYEEVKKSDAKARGVTPAIVVDGKGTGRVVYVKLKKKTTGEQSSSRDTGYGSEAWKKQQEARDRKAKVQAAVNYAVFAKVMEKMNEPAGELIVELLKGEWSYSNGGEEVARRRGWVPPDKRTSDWVPKQLEHLGTPGEAVKFLVELWLASRVPCRGYGKVQLPDELQAAARTLKIDVKKIEEESRAAAKVAEKAKDAGGKTETADRVKPGAKSAKKVQPRDGDDDPTPPKGGKRKRKSKDPAAAVQDEGKDAAGRGDDPGDEDDALVAPGTVSDAIVDAPSAEPWRIGRRVRPTKDATKYGTVVGLGNEHLGTINVAWDLTPAEVKKKLPHDIQEWRRDSLTIVCDDRKSGVPYDGVLLNTGSKPVSDKPTSAAQDQPLSLAAAGVTIDQLEQSTGRVIPDGICPMEAQLAHECTVGTPVRIHGTSYAVTLGRHTTAAVIYRLHPLHAPDPAGTVTQWGERRATRANAKNPPEDVPLGGVRCTAADGTHYVFGDDAIAVEAPVALWSDWMQQQATAAAAAAMGGRKRRRTAAA